MASHPAFWRPGPMMEGVDFYQVLPTFTGKATAFLESQAGVYGDFVNMVDTAVGEVLEALERLELDENTITIVVFTSDNGSALQLIRARAR